MVNERIPVVNGFVLKHGRAPILDELCTLFSVRSKNTASVMAAKFVEARELPVHQRDNVAHGRPLADVELVLVGEPLDHPGRNPLDELPQHGVHCFCRFRKREPKQLGN